MIALIIVAIMLALNIKPISPVISSLVGIAISVVIIGMCSRRLGTIISSIKDIAGYINVDKAYIYILIKLIGIAYLCEFAAGISKDAGYSAVAAEIELFGKLTMLMVSLPVLLEVVQGIIQIM